MNRKKTYWFDQPKFPGAYNLAVCPFLSPVDGRLKFSVPDSGIWQLTGKVVTDGEDYFEFQCDDSIMHARGGLYKFTALNIKDFRKGAYKWISMWEEIANACYNTDDLHYWYRKNWPNTFLQEFYNFEMQERMRKGTPSNC